MTVKATRTKPVIDTQAVAQDGRVTMAALQCFNTMRDTVAEAVTERRKGTRAD